VTRRRERGSYPRGPSCHQEGPAQRRASFADREFSAAERAHVRTALEAVSGIGPAGAQAIADALAVQALEVSTLHTTRFTRTLKELGDRDLRLHVLEMLIELAASDSELRQQEVVVVRQTTAALGLEQDDYNRLQARHRDKLGRG